jgi:hypothetical protein
VALVPTLVGKLTLGASGEVAPDWPAAASFDYVGYTLIDTALKDSEHHRDQFTLRADVLHRWSLGGFRLDGGLGYWARQGSVANKLPPSLSTPFISAPAHFFHGPRLAAAVGYPLLPGLEARAGLGVMPYVFASGEAAVQALQPLIGFEASPELAWQALPRLELALAYRYELLAASGPGYTHLEQGPTLSVQGRF